MYKNGKNITIIDRNNDCIRMILKGISKWSPLTTEEEYELWRRMRQGDNNARMRLINSNLGYVMSVAKEYLLSGADLEDLYQAGALGLCKAVDKFVQEAEQFDDLTMMCLEYKGGADNHA